MSSSETGIRFSLLFAIAGTLLVTAPSLAEENQAKPLEGTYTLYKEGSSKAVTQMTITLAQGTHFNIRGAGQSWSGTGTIETDRGSYNWHFDGGRGGQTTFEVGSDGKLHGHVRGATTSTNWDYVATRAEGPIQLAQAKTKAQGLPKIPCDPSAAPAAPGAGKQYVCHTLTCGGTSQAPVCCPTPNPYLNLCDCNCYKASEDVDCSRGYAACQY